MQLYLVVLLRGPCSLDAFSMIHFQNAAFILALDLSRTIHTLTL